MASQIDKMINYILSNRLIPLFNDYLCILEGFSNILNCDEWEYISYNLFLEDFDNLFKDDINHYLKMQLKEMANFYSEKMDKTADEIYKDIVIYLTDINDRGYDSDDDYRDNNTGYYTDDETYQERSAVDTAINTFNSIESSDRTFVCNCDDVIRGRINSDARYAVIVYNIETCEYDYFIRYDQISAYLIKFHDIISTIRKKFDVIEHIKIRPNSESLIELVKSWHMNDI